MRIKMKSRCDLCKKQRIWVHVIDLPGLDEEYHLCEFDPKCMERVEALRKDPDVYFIAPSDGEYVEVQVKRGSHL